MRTALSARPLARVAPATTVVAIAVMIEAGLVGLHGLNAAALGDGRLLSLDQEGNLPTWFASVLFAFAAVACAAVPLVERRGRAFWAGAALLLAGMSVDEVAMLHEAGEETYGALEAILGWQLFAALGLAVLLWLAGGRQPPSLRRWMRAAAVAVLAAHGASVAGALAADGRAAIVALSVLEEWAEMLVATFALAAAAGVLARYVTVNRAPSS